MYDTLGGLRVRFVPDYHDGAAFLVGEEIDLFSRAFAGCFPRWIGTKRLVNPRI